MSGTYPIDPVVTQQRLEEAEQALHQLMTGQNPQVVSYAQGSGSKQVTYTQATMPALRAYIAQLKRQLGYCSPRRAIGLRFNR